MTDSAITAGRLTADDIITRLTQAASEEEAQAIADSVRSRALLDEVADLLYTDSYGRSPAVIRKAIIREARA